MMENFKEELRSLINRYSIDNKLSTPDYILTDYLIQQLENLKVITDYDRNSKPNIVILKSNKEMLENSIYTCINSELPYVGARFLYKGGQLQRITNNPDDEPKDFQSIKEFNVEDWKEEYRAFENE